MRTKHLSAVAVLLSVLPAAAEPPGPPVESVVVNQERTALLRPSESAEPWLGVSVHKPAADVQGPRPDVPRGVGFVVAHVAPNGPAEAAGLQQHDFLWKLGDQFLINEAQFLVLLHLHEVGETVTLTYRRAGKDREVEVVLQERPTSETGRREADVAALTDPLVPGLPKEVVGILRREASSKGENGITVQVERRGNGFHWQQIDAEGELIQEGQLKGPDDIRFPDGTNDELAQKLRALAKAIEDAEKRAASGMRTPRVQRPLGEARRKSGNPR